MKATVLCYHKIGPASEEGRRLNVEPARLEAHLRYFVRRKLPICRADSLVDGGVCFTFDDAYASTLTHAIPIFDRYCEKATFYAVTDRVGKTSEWDAPQDRPLATWDDLLIAAKNGHEIGNHTQTHPHLDQLRLEDALAEIDGADAALRAQGLDAASLCYPYGHHTAELASVLRTRQYRSVMTLSKPVAGRMQEPLAMPRTVVGYSDALPMLLYKLFVRPRMRR